MKAIFGLALILAGFAIALYAGIWWAFIGGIVAVIEEIRAPQLNSMNVACGIARVMFSGLIGWACGIIPIGIGVSLLKD